ncbi:MAG: hypothetical protein JNM26_08370, partial [Ideonella sp.]|nr:hypothetical protein [Ideonella sp.]
MSLDTTVPSCPTPRRWRLARAVALLATVLGASLGMAQAHDERADRDGDGYAIGLWGDLPYSAAQAAVGVPNLIADMNAHRLAFTVHDGDLKAGSGSLCDDNLYHQALSFFDALRAPAIFTPGDNDWTDCDRPANGGYHSRERLDT